MIRQVFQSFIPDDKPIAAIAVLEDSHKCPTGYTVINKTLDQDSDADMWRESALALFKRKTRYLCISKTEGLSDYIVENISIINEKETPPDGFCLIARTIDSDQKAWRKRQVCYKLTRRVLAKSCITDIIFLSRTKKPLEGYTSAGDLNGLTLCYKTGANVNETPTNSSGDKLSYNLTPTLNDVINSYANLPLPVTGKQRAPSPPNDYQPIMGDIMKPSRPAPRPPPPSNYATIGPDEGLQGVPFVLNPLIDHTISNVLNSVLHVKPKTRAEIEKEFSYDFHLEKAVINLEKEKAH